GLGDLVLHGELERGSAVHATTHSERLHEDVAVAVQEPVRDVRLEGARAALDGGAALEDVAGLQRRHEGERRLGGLRRGVRARVAGGRFGGRGGLGRGRGGGGGGRLRRRRGRRLGGGLGRRRRLGRGVRR